MSTIEEKDNLPLDDDSKKSDSPNSKPIRRTIFGSRNVTDIVKSLKPELQKYLSNLVECNDIKVSQVHDRFEYATLVNVNKAWNCMGVFYDYLIRKEIYNLKKESAFDQRASLFETPCEVLSIIKASYEDEQVAKVMEQFLANENEGDDSDSEKCVKKRKIEADEIEIIKSWSKSLDADGSKEEECADENEDMGDFTSDDFYDYYSLSRLFHKEPVNDGVSFDIMAFYYARKLRRLANSDEQPSQNFQELKECYRDHEQFVDLLYDNSMYIQQASRNFDSVNKLALSYKRFKDQNNASLDILEDIYNTSMLHMVFFCDRFTPFNHQMINELNIKVILEHVKTFNLNNILINPIVGNNYFKADADLILEDTVLDIKTSKYASLKAGNRNIQKREFYQLIFYALGLYINENKEIHKFKIYNPLLGYEYVMELPQLNFSEFFELVKKESPI